VAVLSSQALSLAAAPPPGADAYADLGNPADEAYHNLHGWGSMLQNVSGNPSGDTNFRYQGLRQDNSVDLTVPLAGVAYQLRAEVEEGGCDDSFDILVNGTLLYSFRSTRHPYNVALVHTVNVSASHVPTQVVTVTFRNTATDSCGLAAVYNVSLSTSYSCGPLGNQLNTCDLQKGDVILTHASDFDPLYLFEHKLFGGYWTHAGIYDGDGTITEARPDCSKWPLDSNFCGPPTLYDLPGVTRGPIGGPACNSPSPPGSCGFGSATDWAILRLKASVPQAGVKASDAVDRANSKIGAHYNWNYVDKYRDDKFFCSQLVWWAYNQAGVDLDSGSLLNIPISVPPDDLYHDDDLVRVAERPGLLRGILRLLSPADLYVTDQFGRHAGVDPNTHLIVNEIPGVAYTGPDAEPEVMSFENFGELSVVVTGTGSGPYTIQGEAVDQVSPGVTSVTGTTSIGQTDSYTAAYTVSPGSSITISQQAATPAPVGGLVQMSVEARSRSGLPWLWATLATGLVSRVRLSETVVDLR
jgi:cell wall-associated NlpC family hydrolase